MARSLSPIGLFAKWVIVPVALLGAGYYFVGPRIGDKAFSSIKPNTQPAAAADTSEPTPEDTGVEARSTSQFAEPEVDVKVTPIASSSSSSEDRPRRRRRSQPRREEKREEPTETAPSTPAEPVEQPDPTPPDDGGGSGGAVGMPPPTEPPPGG